MKNILLIIFAFVCWCLRQTRFPQRKPLRALFFLLGPVHSSSYASQGPECILGLALHNVNLRAVSSIQCLVGLLHTQPMLGPQMCTELFIFRHKCPESFVPAYYLL